MRTFKVTFFDKDLEIVNVSTFHNVVNQAEFTKMLAVQIYTLELHTFVKCESDGKNYTQAVNYFLQQEIEELEKANA